LLLFLEVEIPEIMIGKCDDESRTEQDQGSAHVLAPIGLDAINRDGSIEGEGETEDLEEQSKWNSRVSFEKPTETDGYEIGEDKRDNGSGRALRANEGLDHRHSILPINRQWDKGDGISACPNFQTGLQMRPPRFQASYCAEDRLLACPAVIDCRHRNPNRLEACLPETRLPLFVRVNFKSPLVFR